MVSPRRKCYVTRCRKHVGQISEPRSAHSARQRPHEGERVCTGICELQPVRLSSCSASFSLAGRWLSFPHWSSGFRSAELSHRPRRPAQARRRDRRGRTASCGTICPWARTSNRFSPRSSRLPPRSTTDPSEACLSSTQLHSRTSRSKVLRSPRLYTRERPPQPCGHRRSPHPCTRPCHRRRTPRSAQGPRAKQSHGCPMRTKRLGRSRRRSRARTRLWRRCGGLRIPGATFR